MASFNNLRETIDKFLESIVNRDSSEDGTYKPKILSFYKYLIAEKDLINRMDFQTELKSINYMDIKYSMKFYIKASKDNPKKVSAIVTLKLYLTVVQEYFYFLNDNNISNHPLISQFNLWMSETVSFGSIINEVAAEENLRDKASMKPLSQFEVDQLLVLCDKTIDNFSITKKDPKSTMYKFYVSSLIIKIFIESGIKYRVISSINREDINFQSNLLILHSKYQLPLTNKLAGQLVKYLDNREHVLVASNRSTNKLFVTFKEKADVEKNTYLREFLRKTGRSDTTGISKYRIIRMMELGIPENIIKEITTFESSVVDDCRKYVNNFKEDYSFINRFIQEKMGVNS